MIKKYQIELKEAIGLYQEYIEDQTKLRKRFKELGRLDFHRLYSEDKISEEDFNKLDEEITFVRGYITMNRSVINGLSNHIKDLKKKIKIYQRNNH
jgi:hypothetical protein